MAEIIHADCVEEVARWLQRQGFPFDHSTTEPLPAFLFRPLAEAWAEADDEPVENYEWAIRQEQAIEE